MAEVEQTTKRRRTLIRGLVVSDKMTKTRVIELKRVNRHSLYHKNIARKSRIFIHDEKNESKTGDLVLAGLTRPLSKNKNFALVKVLQKRVGQ
jgi:small subunit ribosomal protein S17